MDSGRRYKVCFLLGTPDINGGTYVIYEHGARLKEMGHDVYIVTQEAVTPDRYNWHPFAKTLSWLTYEQAQKQQFDLVLATWWRSPFLLAGLSSSHYAYFVQSIESRFFEQEDPAHHDERDLGIWQQYCESTYGLQVPVITEATWIKDYLFENYNHHAFLVRNGIRKDLYSTAGTPAAPREEGKLRVLVEGPVDVHYKNVPAAIRLCLRAEVDEIWLLTSSDISEYDGVDRVFSRIPIFETPAIYRSCDVLVKLSYIEGMFGPPLEMFHCGGTSIVYHVTGHDEYIVHDENSYVVQQDDEERVVEYLVRLKTDINELNRLKKGALKTAEKWPDWQQAAKGFEKAVGQILIQPPISRNYLQDWTERCNQQNSYNLRNKEIDLFQNREKSDCSIDNFIQIYYWTEQGGLDPSNFVWAHYKTGDRVQVKLEVPAIGFPFCLRLDPSVRVGMIELFSIHVRSSITGETYAELVSSEQLDRVQTAGTMRKLNSSTRAVFLSYGDDPQLILPAITAGKTGDTLEVSVSLRETGVHSFLESEMSEKETGYRAFAKKIKRTLKKAVH